MTAPSDPTLEDEEISALRLLSDLLDACNSVEICYINQATKHHHRHHVGTAGVTLLSNVVARALSAGEPVAWRRDALNNAMAEVKSIHECIGERGLLNQTAKIQTHCRNALDQIESALQRPFDNHAAPRDGEEK